MNTATGRRCPRAGLARLDVLAPLAGSAAHAQGGGDTSSSSDGRHRVSGGGGLPDAGLHCRARTTPYGGHRRTRGGSVRAAAALAHAGAALLLARAGTRRLRRAAAA